MADPSEEREQRATDALYDTAAEIGQQAIAILTSQEVLKEVPFLRIGVAAARAARSVADQLWLKRIDAFIRGLDSVTLEQRREMVQRLGEDRHYSETVAEHLAEYLSRIEGRRKALMSAAAFAAFARREIDQEMLYSVTHAIEVMLLTYLRSARSLCDEGPYMFGTTEAERSVSIGRSYHPSAASIQSLSAAGLVTGASGWGGMVYDLTDVGKAFIEKLRLDLIAYD